ncbi:MAG: FHA domain-containing protein [Phycisphaeraceae bacterium]|nr:FHA domain-containing protein [Phycisphaerae bacterium]MBX3391324.1 FHA domain-containing protein [Phycisphaeraceae bacterium]HRJ49830.1 ATP-binding protein [Phycisphaerales bacterium]
MLVLSVIQGPDKGRTFQLPANEPQLIGRSSEALPIEDTTVSRRHAELTPDDGIWWIRDLSSQNGTYVNGVAIQERTRLRPGDQIRTGSTLFVFGVTESSDPEVVRLLGPNQIDASVDRSIPSNEDSVILSEPEPRAAAVDHLRVIYQLTSLVSQATDRQQLLKGVMDVVFEEFEPERGFILMAQPPVAAGSPPINDPRIVPAVVRYQVPPRNPDDARINVSRTIVMHVLRKSEGVLSTNAMNDPRFKAGDSVQRFHIRSAIGSPIRSRDRVFGAIYIDSTLANYTFTVEQLNLMNAIGQHTGLALANAELYSEKLRSERLAAMGEAVASLSHSVKNILQGLRGGADVVELGLKKDDLQIAKKGWGILRRNVDRIVTLTGNMLAYSRQRRVEVQLAKLGAVLDDVTPLIQPQAQAKGIAFLVDADPEMPPIPIDPEMIHQALMNLVGNAIEAVAPETGAVTVRALYHTSHPGGRAQAGSLGPCAEIAVIDNGPGIPADRIPWLYEPFNTTKGLRGTGLGLAVTKRIVEEHGGRIDVESHTASGPQRGTIFRVFLPADSESAIDPSATSA